MSKRKFSLLPYTSLFRRAYYGAECGIPGSVWFSIDQQVSDTM
jgi:hypothetical protein